MKVLDPGHYYVLDQLDIVNNSKSSQAIRFVKRLGAKYPGNKGKAFTGILLQEVFRVCIDRLQYLDKQEPHECNERIITLLRLAIYHLERRAYERHNIEFDLYIKDIELLPTNSHGHLWKEHD